MNNRNRFKQKNVKLIKRLRAKTPQKYKKYVKIGGAIAGIGGVITPIYPITGGAVAFIGTSILTYYQQKIEPQQE